MNGPAMNVIATHTVAVLHRAVINRDAPSRADFLSFFALHRRSDCRPAAPVRNKNVVSHSSRASLLDCMPLTWSGQKMKEGLFLKLSVNPKTEGKKEQWTLFTSESPY